MSPAIPAAAPPEPDAWWRSRWICLATSATGFMLLLLLERLIPPGGAASLWIAWSLGSAWYCGRAIAVSLAMAALAVSAGLSPPESVSQIVVLLMTWGLNIGLIFWITELQRQLQSEFRLARRDTLTGVANRQAILERCEAELSRARRFQRPFTIVLLDGDSFKAINDRYGHPAGDLVLCRTAAALSESVRQYDLVGRLGGDEFVILLPEVAADDAQIVIKRVQTALDKQVEQLQPTLTYSIGAVTFLPSTWEVAQCLAEADRVLYAAKRAGKKSSQFKTVEKSVPLVEDRGE